MDDVAFVDLSDAGDPVDRGGQPGVAQIDLRVLDNRLIAFHRSLKLSDLGLLGIDELTGRKAFCLQRHIATEIGLGIVKLGLIAIPICNGLVELGLVWARVYFCENITLVHGFSLTETDLDQRSGDLAAKNNVVE